MFLCNLVIGKEDKISVDSYDRLWNGWHRCDSPVYRAINFKQNIIVAIGYQRQSALCIFHQQVWQQKKTCCHMQCHCQQHWCVCLKSPLIASDQRYLWFYHESFRVTTKCPSHVMSRGVGRFNNLYLVAEASSKRRKGKSPKNAVVLRTNFSPQEFSSSQQT